MRSCWGAIGVLLLTLIGTCATAAEPATPILENWHQWRGPIATGVAPAGDPPTNWDEKTNIRWKVKIPGASTATPIVWGDRVFLITAVKTDRTGETEPEPQLEPATPENRLPSAKGDAAAEAPKTDSAAGGKQAVPRARGFRTVPAPTNVYQFIVLAVDRETGKTLWEDVVKETVPHEAHHPDGSFASASPMTDGKLLYASFGSRGVYCYDLEGHQKWARDLGRMTIFNTFGEGASPVVHGDSVVVNWDHQAGSFIICLDALTGATRWKVERDENSTWATPLVVDYQGRTQVIVNGSNRVRSYDLKDGSLIWACGGQGPSAIPTPVTDGQRVFAMTGFITNSIFAIPLDSTGDITGVDDKVAWKNRKLGTPYVPSPILYDKLLYFTAGNKGILTCLDSATGEPLVDKQRLEGIANIYASPVGAAGRIYFTSREGNTVVVKLGAFEKSGDKNQAVIVASNPLDDRFDASAAIVGNQIFMRGNEYLYCIAAD